MFEESFEIERIFALKSSILVSVELVFFQLRGGGHPQGDAMPNFFPQFKRSILGLSIEVSLAFEIFFASLFSLKNVTLVHKNEKSKFDVL